jgi:hypothetical protein
MLHIFHWNQVLLEAIGRTKTSPPVAARALAIVHTAMFDAWAAYDEKAVGMQLGGILRRPENERTLESKREAISIAAYRTLVDLFPTEKAAFDAALNDLGFDSSNVSADFITPSGIGNLCAQMLLGYRHGDGSNQLGDRHPGAYSDYTGYTPINTVDELNDPSRWQPLLVNGVPQTWILPQWGLVRPFALTSSAQFRAFLEQYGPAQYPYGSYHTQTVAVVHFSAELDDFTKTVAEYWADGPGSITPPGHWNRFAQQISRRDDHTLDDDVKMFLILGNTLMDASIAVWDCKRATDSIRPVSAIRFLFRHGRIRAWAGPGRGTEEIEGRAFQSYIPTPPFASYISGHSTFSASAAEVLKRFTNSDYFGESFTKLPGTSDIEPGITPAVSITLSWETFSEAADQAGISRRYGGIHFEADDILGRVVGRRVAEVVWDKAMAYINGTAPR